jgi:surface antigen
VLAWRGRQAGGRPLYSGTGSLRLCWRCLLGLAALICGLAAGGCSFQLHSLLAQDEADVDQTGSINRPAVQSRRGKDTAVRSESDLAYARAAASDVLAHGGKDSSVPWQNPNTGAGGNITPLAAAHLEDGLSCRGFLASYVHGDSQDWLEGSACRTGQGNWEVKSLKPLKQG